MDNKLYMTLLQEIFKPIILKLLFIYSSFHILIQKRKSCRLLFTRHTRKSFISDFEGIYQRLDPYL